MEGLSGDGGGPAEEVVQEHYLYRHLIYATLRSFYSKPTQNSWAWLSHLLTILGRYSSMTPVWPECYRQTKALDSGCDI
jgi:hypothetical protein